MEHWKSTIHSLLALLLIILIWSLLDIFMTLVHYIAHLAISLFRRWLILVYKRLFTYMLSGCGVKISTMCVQHFILPLLEYRKLPSLTLSFPCQPLLILTNPYLQLHIFKNEWANYFVWIKSLMLFLPAAWVYLLFGPWKLYNVHPRFLSVPGSLIYYYYGRKLVT